MMALHAALVQGFFVEAGLSVQGVPVNSRAVVEAGKPHYLWMKTPTGLTETDFGFLDIDQLHHMAAGKVDYYIVDGIHFGCMDIMVPVDSPIKSVADLKGKTVAINPWWVAPFRSPHGLTFFNAELKTRGLDPAKDVAMTSMPWEAIPKLSEYVAEGFSKGRFDAVGVTEPDPLLLQERKLARSILSQTYQAPYNQEYCCLFGIKRAIVDGQPDKAALIVRAYRRAKQWIAADPERAAVATQAAGYAPRAVPVGSLANLLTAFGFDRQIDLAQSLERSFKERIDAGAIQTDKTPKELVRLHYRRIE